MKVVAKFTIVEAGALRMPGEVFEVDESRFKSLGDVVEAAPEIIETETAQPDPEEEEKQDPRKISPLDKLKNLFGFSGGKVDLDISNLSEVTREDLDGINKDQINDLFASLEDLELKPKMKKDEMIDAVFEYIERVSGKGSEENGSE